MEINGRLARQILLLSLIVLIIPMIVFPQRFGMNLMRASLFNVMYELIFYGFVIYFYSHRATLIQLMQTAGICLIYRFILGLVLGLLIVIMYPMDVIIAVTLGMSSYLPAILLHIAAAPFILKPVINDLISPTITRKTVLKKSAAVDSGGTGMTSISVSKEKGFSKAKVKTFNKSESTAAGRFPSSGSSVKSTGETNGFEKAMNYIGEDGSIELAAVVDNEGLLLSNFKRGDIVPEDWAPFSVLLAENNNKVLSQIGYEALRKVDIIFKDKKIIVASEETYYLMVISDRAVDDVLNIRINQGLEMIRKYVSERYSEKLVGNAERIYV